MSASTPLNTPKFSFRSKSFWGICLFSIYSIFGWFIVPSIVESQLKENLKTLANWNTQVDKIGFNPYTLSLKVSDADIQDQNAQKVISFEELFINFSLLDTLGGTISFDEISLIEPFIHLDIDQHGITNFQHAFASDNKDPEPETEEGSGEIIGLFFDLLAISSGKIHLSDNSQGENFQLDLEPLSLSLEDFSTLNNDGGNYTLSIVLGNDQNINWQGQIGIAPFRSQGHLELKSIDSNSFWHYVKSASPYWLKHARISLSGDYQTAISSDQTQLNIENTALVIEHAALSESAESDALITFKHLKVAPISFDLAELSLDLGEISLNQPSISIERFPDASLNILRPLNAQTKTRAEKETALEPSQDNKAETNKNSFQWTISGIDISEGSITWKDSTLPSPAELGIHDMGLTVGQMSDDLSQAFPYALSFSVMDPRRNSSENPSKPAEEMTTKQVMQGSLSPRPFTIKGRAELTNIELATFQHYISETANITLEKGHLNLQSEYALAMLETNAESGLSGKILSTLIIDDLAVTDNNLNKPLSGFKQFSLGPVNVALSGDSTDINIESAVLDQPYGDILVSEDGRINLSQLAKSKTESPEHRKLEKSQAPSETKSNSEPSHSIAMLLKLIEIKQGQFTYTDASLTPSFTAQLSELNGTIENISTDSEAKSKVAFEGKIGSHGKLNIEGSLNPLSKKPNTDIKVLASNIDLTMASPYAQKYAGYQIAKGKLDLDLSYLINDMKLTANNQVLLNQFEFGKSVDSPDSTSLPLPLAIGILKDRNGKIDINLPISGDLNDPSFKITSVILNTFVNLVTKVVTSPFSILSGLIEGNDDISDIQFMANSSKLSPEQIDKIISLAKVLTERPNLTLEIRGLADVNIDQKDNAARPESELIQLAKDRALEMNKIIIEEGNIDAARVFVLEPEIIALVENDQASTENTEPIEKTAPTISSKFTLGVR